MLGSPFSNHYMAIVDDDESVCRSLSRLLRAVGYPSATYPSAEAILDHVKRPQFDCLGLNVRLLRTSGLELSNRLAAVNDTTPVVFITAQDEPEERAMVEAVGCADYFRKTDPCAEVLDVIDRIINPNGTLSASLPT